MATKITQAEDRPELGPSRTNTKRTFVFAAIVIIVGFLGTTLPQFQLLGLIPLKNLLKNELHQDRSSTAAFFFWMQFAWYFKPFFGIITDAFPLFGTRRRSYALIGALLTVASFVMLLFTPQKYNDLLLVCTLINVFMVVTSTVLGGYMVEAAQSLGAPGRLTAVRNFVEQFSYVIAGPVGGLLGAISFGWTAAAGGAIVFLIVPTTIFFLKEQKTKIDSKKLISEAGKQLKRVGSAKVMWAAAGFSFLFYFAPGIQTAEFYQQQNVMHLNTQSQGMLLFLQGVFGVLSAILYGTFFCWRVKLRWLLLACLTIGAASQFGYSFYTTFHRAWFIDSFWGLGWTAADMTLMDLMVRATPTGSEGLGFSLMLSVRNLSLFGSDWAGAKVMDTYHLHLSTMATANALVSLIALPFIFFLPGFIVDRKDSSAEAAALPPGTGKALLEE